MNGYPETFLEIGETEIPELSFLARKIWLEHYPAIIGEAQTDYMLEKMYSLEALKEQMIIKKHRFFF